jgi:hypothetical protein
MARPSTTMAAPQMGITTSAVSRASTELEKMKGSLKGWLKYRQLNDDVLAGRAKTKIPPGLAQRIVAQSRDVAAEQDLANKLHALLSELLPGANLPDPDLGSNRNVAVQLAQIALAGGQAQSQSSMAGILSASSASHPWLWPVLIVGGLLLAVTTAVKTAADVAKERERYACIQAGACTDYGFWLKAGGVTVLAWFAWTQLGVGDAVRGLMKRRT